MALLATRQEYSREKKHIWSISSLGRHHLPDPGVKQQIGVALQANASLEETLEGVALPVETVDDLSA